ncbi:hypothetical protein [Alteromonas sp. KUL42]|nr:hypothetical protein [Alteromonas sp. KUL42]
MKVPTQPLFLDRCDKYTSSDVPVKSKQEEGMDMRNFNVEA